MPLNSTVTGTGYFRHSQSVCKMGAGDVTAPQGIPVACSEPWSLADGQKNGSSHSAWSRHSRTNTAGCAPPGRSLVLTASPGRVRFLGLPPAPGLSLPQIHYPKGLPDATWWPQWELQVPIQALQTAGTWAGPSPSCCPHSCRGFQGMLVWSEAPKDTNTGGPRVGLAVPGHISKATVVGRLWGNPTPRRQQERQPASRLRRPGSTSNVPYKFPPICPCRTL